MAESLVIVTEKRDTRGTRTARRLRAEGRVPGVVYGHKEETVSVSVAADLLLSAVRHGARVVDLQSGGALQKAQIAELQWDHLGQEVLHVDFRRVAADERIHVTVPIEVRGIAPGVTAGGVLDQPIHTLSVECAADSVPETIRVNINELQLGGAIHVHELHLPPNVTALADADAIVVHVTLPQAEPEAGAVPGVEQAEPEIIGRKAAAEEGEEEK
ncbi:MAG TPA: 50S ribosomal protein L25 [Gemmataceae bacterium]|nr:50S ribosomal protein L25 [Gemmataceae bacterium]